MDHSFCIVDLYKGQQYKVRIAIKSGQLTGRYTDWVTVTLTGGKPKKGKINRIDQHKPTYVFSHINCSRSFGVLVQSSKET